MALVRKPIGELLVDNGQITAEELDLAQRECKKTGERMSVVLSRLGLASESHLKNALELQYGVTYISLAKAEPSKELLELLPEQLMRENLIVPISEHGSVVTIAMVDPNSSEAMDAIKSRLADKQIKPVVCTEDDFDVFMNTSFKELLEQADGNGKADATTGEGTASTAKLEERAPTDLSESEKAAQTGAEDKTSADSTQPEKTAAESQSEASHLAKSERLAQADPGEETATDLMAAGPPSQDINIEGAARPGLDVAAARKTTQPVEQKEEREEDTAIVLLANQILASAISKNASTIHIETQERHALVHYRVNGELQTARKLPSMLMSNLMARLRVMGRVAPNSKPPQDGRIKVRMSGKEHSLRLSIVNGTHGESAIVWLE